MLHVSPGRTRPVATVDFNYSTLLVFRVSEYIRSIETQRALQVCRFMDTRRVPKKESWQSEKWGRRIHIGIYYMLKIHRPEMSLSLRKYYIEDRGRKNRARDGRNRKTRHPENALFMNLHTSFVPSYVLFSPRLLHSLSHIGTVIFVWRCVVKYIAKTHISG